MPDVSTGTSAAAVRGGSARTLVVAAAIAALAGSAAAADPAPPVLVIVRTGALAREEVSPGSRAAASTSWTLALSGATAAEVRFPSPPSAASADAIREALIPASVGEAFASRGAAVVLADLPTPDAVLAALASTEARKPESVARLEAVFGAPPPPIDEDEKAVAALASALSGRKGPAAGREGPATADLGAVVAARPGFVRIAAASADPAAVEARERLLARLRSRAGNGAWTIVVNWPATGLGSVIVEGPGARPGRVVPGERSSAVVSAILAAALGIAAADLPEASRREDVRELIR